MSTRAAVEPSVPAPGSVANADSAGGSTRSRQPSPPASKSPFSTSDGPLLPGEVGGRDGGGLVGGGGVGSGPGVMGGVGAALGAGALGGAALGTGVGAPRRARASVIRSFNAGRSASRALIATAPST